MIKINNNTNVRINDSCNFSFLHRQRHLRRCYNEKGLCTCRLSDALEPPWAFLKLMSEWRMWWRDAMNISCMTHMRERERERAEDAVLGSVDDAGRLTDRNRKGREGGCLFHAWITVLLLCIALYPEGKHPRRIGRNRSPDPNSKWLISKPLCFDVMNKYMYREMISVFTVYSKWQPWNIWFTLNIAVKGYCIFTVLYMSDKWKCKWSCLLLFIVLCN